jgi:hypothetical protein
VLVQETKDVRLACGSSERAGGLVPYFSVPIFVVKDTQFRHTIHASVARLPPRVSFPCGIPSGEYELVRSFAESAQKLHVPELLFELHKRINHVDRLVPHSICHHRLGDDTHSPEPQRGQQQSEVGGVVYIRVGFEAVLRDVNFFFIFIFIVVIQS